jgi:hypothetical protein
MSTTRADVLRQLDHALQRVDAVAVELRDLRKAIAEAPRPQAAPKMPPDMTVPSPFVGTPGEASCAGVCCVCGESIKPGAPIVHTGDKRAHIGCGRRRP